MKVLFLTAFALMAGTFLAKAQTKASTAEKKLTDSICNCVAKVDVSKIKTAEEANSIIMDCFGMYSSLLVDIAEERKVNIDNEAAMSLIGADVGKNLLKQNCSNFIKLSVKSDEASDAVISSTDGVFKRIDLKGFNYIIITDLQGKEKSFLWLRQFEGAENFTGNTITLAGKKVKIKWQEMEVYLPAAKDYYKVKEITAIEILK